MLENYIYGVGNKIIISKYIQNFDIIYDVCTHKEVERFVDNNLQSKHITSYHPLKYSLMSLLSKATSYRN
jgi:UDP-N-acetylglucosamine 2-epimerase